MLCGEPDILAKRENYLKIGFPRLKDAGSRLKADNGTMVIIYKPFFRPDILVYVFLSLKGGKIVGLRIIYQKSGFAEVLK